MKKLFAVIPLLIFFLTSADAQHLQLEWARETMIVTEGDSGHSIDLTFEQGKPYYLRKIRLRNIKLITDPMARTVTYTIMMDQISGMGTMDWELLDTTGTMLLNAFAASGSDCSSGTVSMSVYQNSIPEMGSAFNFKDFYIKFRPPMGQVAPYNNGGVNLTILNCSNAPATSVIVGLSGHLVSNTPKAITLVMDRSGSMSQIVTGTTQRQSILRESANYFVDLLQLRGNAMDSLGILSYDDQIVTIKSLGETTTAQYAALLGSSGLLANTDLNPRNSTAIGQAMQAANGFYTHHGTGHIAILFTDGQENVFPPDMASADISKIQTVHTVGMGGLVTSSFQVNLHTYAGNHHGSYAFVAEDVPTSVSGGSLPIGLEKAFLSIFADLTDAADVIDPIFQVTLDGQQKTVGTAWVTSSDGIVTFSVFEDLPAARELYDLELVTPKGEVVSNTMASGIKAQVVINSGYRIYSTSFGAAPKAAYVGEWKLILKPKTTKNLAQVVQIGFSVVANSSVTTTAAAASTTSLPGDEIVANFGWSDGEFTLKPKKLLVLVRTPNGEEIKVTPKLNAQGKWEVRYSDTQTSGTYQIFARAALVTPSGELTTRESVQHVAVSKPAPPVFYECVSCNFTRILYWAVLVLILVVVVYVAKRFFSKA